MKVIRPLAPVPPAQPLAVQPMIIALSTYGLHINPICATFRAAIEAARQLPLLQAVDLVLTAHEDATRSLRTLARREAGHVIAAPYVSAIQALSVAVDQAVALLDAGQPLDTDLWMEAGEILQHLIAHLSMQTLGAERAA